MIDNADRQIYFEMSFNQQMTWLGEEIQAVITSGVYKEKEEYGKMEHTHSVKRLFEIVKSDPKNKAHLGELLKAEENFKAFLDGTPDALTKDKIFAYWDFYMSAYVAELKNK